MVYKVYKVYKGKNSMAVRHPGRDALTLPGPVEAIETGRLDRQQRPERRTGIWIA
jgi:hypothetical protein